jgi:F0F1-type ATP synthase membrane subunit c/vacuolar-type H+-ATPase subunit K
MPSTRITQLVIGIAAAFGMAAVSVSAIGNGLSAVAVLGAAARRHGRLRVQPLLRVYLSHCSRFR